MLLPLLAGCAGGGADAPSRLYDGARPAPVPGVLDGLDNAVMTTVRSLPRGAPAVRACAERFRGVRADGGVAVVRTGVDGGSITFAVGPLVYACDSAARSLEPGPGPDGDRCGASAGKRIGGRLADRRLQLAGCVDRDERTVAFLWVDPAARARWLAVERDGWTEVADVRSGLPVRIATVDGVDQARASVRLRVSHYGADGEQVRSEELEVRVAG